MSEDLLKQGMATFKAGRKAEAGELFSQLIQRDPEDEMAWLWLSGTVETASERLACLERVLEINPHNGIALRGIKTLRRRVREPVAAPAGLTRQTLSRPQAAAESEPATEAAPVESEPRAVAATAESETPAEEETVAEAAPAESEASAEVAAADVTGRINALMRQAVDAIKAGDPETGKTLLVEALKLDEDNEAAWLWMTRCVTRSDLKWECFERVLEINPYNQHAIRGLERLEAAWEEAAAAAEENTSEGTPEGEEKSASVQKPRLARRTKVLIGMVAAAALVAVVLLVFLG